MEYFLAFVFICLVLGAIGIVYGKKGVEPIPAFSVREHPTMKRKRVISEPVSEMIKRIESGEGFTLDRIPGGIYVEAYYLRFGEMNPQIVVGKYMGDSYTDLDWVTTDEQDALVSAAYKYIADEKLAYKQKERNRWCEILGVTQDTE